MIDRILLGLFHCFLALALPLALIFLVSCIPQAHEEKAALGPQVSADVVQNLLNQAGSGDSSNLAVGQMLHYQQSERLENQDPDILLEDAVYSVISRTVDTNLGETIITVHNSVQSRNDASTGFTDVESESAIEIPASTSNNLPQIQLDGGPGAPSGDPQPVNITYHNLVTYTALAAPPPSPAARSGCSGLSPCQLDVTYISFDEAYWWDSTNYNVYHYDYEFTATLPFMGDSEGALLNGCVGGYEQVNDYPVYVRSCLSLIDFQK